MEQHELEEMSRRGTYVRTYTDKTIGCTKHYTVLSLILVLLFSLVDKKPDGVGWQKLKLQSTLPGAPSSGGKKYSPAVGKYESLNKVWRPVHKICFLNPYSKHDDELFQVRLRSEFLYREN